MILPNKQPGMRSLADMPNPSKSAPDPPKHTRAAGFGGAVDQGHASAKVEDLARFSAKTDDPEASPPLASFADHLEALRRPAACC